MSIKRNKIKSSTKPGQISAFSDCMPSISQTMPLRVYVEQSLKAYLSQLEGQQATELYSIVLAEVEAPLFRVILEYTQHNQSQAAQLLGLSRNTLHKKLKQYHLL